MADKVNLEKNLEDFKEIVGKMTSLYEDKNRRYNDSFGRQFRRQGMAMTLVRIEDKYSRLEYLVRNPQDKGDDETIEDTLYDLANYCVMSLISLKNEKEV